MTSAWNEQNYEVYEELFDSRHKRLQNLLSEERFLIFSGFGGLDWSGVQKMKILERRYYIDKISEASKSGDRNE